MSALKKYSIKNGEAVAMVIFGTALCSPQHFCARRFTKGSWITEGDCQSDNRIDDILTDLKKRVANKARQRPPACGPSGFRFPNDEHLHYVKYKGTLPAITSFTACVWVRNSNQSYAREQAIVSYCKSGSKNCNTFVVWAPQSETKIGLNSRLVAVPGSFRNYGLRYRTHLCVVKSDTYMSVYINGTVNTVNISHHVIPGGGDLILGQNLDQDEGTDWSIKPKNPHQGFRGDIEGFRLWNRALNSSEIDILNRPSTSCTDDSIVNFTRSNSVVIGDVSFFKTMQQCTPKRS